MVWRARHGFDSRHLHQKETPLLRGFLFQRHFVLENVLGKVYNEQRSRLRPLCRDVGYLLSFFSFSYHLRATKPTDSTNKYLKLLIKYRDGLTFLIPQLTSFHQVGQILHPMFLEVFESLILMNFVLCKNSLLGHWQLVL